MKGRRLARWRVRIRCDDGAKVMASGWNTGAWASTSCSALSHANCRGAISGLYLCGSAIHPDGGVTCSPRHNAAMELLGR
ncbi:hypothetical protein [Xanthomonas translucens]|uniref:hypothetical protein n=1 Tax=Xanthomonas campestris pv. translucens TaxID=343 RepID=UPI0002A2D20A|nr:hypothetical protein [Xanthomonas translucens]CCP39178.1 hypothetical protein BN444_00897 [Xanthomonas translucens pv. translucens DSM 18974]